MLKPEALFINGMYESVLQEIMQVQSEILEESFFLQPYSPKRIRKLWKDPPTVETPMQLFLSTTEELATVRYEAEIVGWDDKRTLSEAKRDVLNSLITRLQPRQEGGLYNALPVKRGQSVNLIHIRRLQFLANPYSVEQFRKTSDGKPLSSNRKTAGGWAYVKLDN